MAQPLGVYRNRTVEFKRRRTTTPKSGVHRSRSFSVGGALSPYYFQYHAPLSKSNIPSKKGSKGPILSPCCSTCQHFYCAFGWQEDDGSAALLPRDEKDVENGRAHAGGRLPPEWVDDMDSCKEIMAMIVGKIKILSKMHHEHITKPSFDGGMEQEHQIEIQTAEITGFFHKAQKVVQVISRKAARQSSEQMRKMSKNAVSSIAKELQDLSMQFRGSQSSYLKRMKGREERERGYGLDGMDGGSSLVEGEIDASNYVDNGFSDEQLNQLTSNTNKVTEREREITKVVESIHELSEIFKDMALLVVEQGSILDRIDYNIESAGTAVEEGVKQLEKATKYQKSATKKKCIIFLIVAIICLLIIGGAISKF